MKKWAYRVLKIIWIIIGIIFLLFFILAWIKMESFSGSGFAGIGGAIGVAMLFIITAAMLAGYAGITILFLFIKWLIKKIRNRKSKK